MSRIDNLIQELCPDGVEFAELGLLHDQRRLSPSKTMNSLGRWHGSMVSDGRHSR